MSNQCDQRVKQAFVQVRDGRSAEFVICSQLVNEKFLAAARCLGIEETDAAINSRLLNLRKKNQLKDYPTSTRKQRDPHLAKYRHAVLNAMRIVERQCSKNVDDVICDPVTRAHFDAIVQFLKPGTSAFEAQFAALNLRKSNQLKPEPVGQIIRSVASKILKITEIEERTNELPTTCGVYIFFNENSTLYAGKAENLRARIIDHIGTWSFRELIQQIRDGKQPNAFVVYHALPITLSAKELAAYETELIRSRNPDHNRTGKKRGAE